VGRRSGVGAEAPAVGWTSGGGGAPRATPAANIEQAATMAPTPATRPGRLAAADPHEI
jgi:hypothetical protein